MVEQALQTISSSSSTDMTPLQDALAIVEATLNVLADSVLQEQPAIRRKKLEHLVCVFKYFKMVMYLKIFIIIYKYKMYIYVWK